MQLLRAPFQPCSSRTTTGRRPQQLFQPAAPCKRWHGRVQCRSQDSSSPVVTSRAVISYDVPSAEAKSSLRFDLVPEGKGQAIVVLEVAKGSTAEQLGIKPGMKLLAVSDPVRYTEMWRLEDRPSMRIVNDLMRLRISGSITMELEETQLSDFGLNQYGRPLAQPRFSGGVTGSMASVDDDVEASASASSSSPAAPAAGGMTMAEKLAMQYAVSGEGEEEVMLGRLPGDADGDSIGDQLEQRFQTSSRLQTESQKRMARRQAYMEQDMERDDTGFFLGVGAIFILPAFAILAVAYFSGYLDNMYTVSLSNAFGG